MRNFIRGAGPAGLAWLALTGARAATVNTTFDDNSGSSWGTAANWSTGVVPNNGVDDYNVTMNASTTVSDMGAANTEITSFTTVGDTTFQGSFTGQTLTMAGNVDITTGTTTVDGALDIILNGTTNITGNVILRNGVGYMNNGNMTVGTGPTPSFSGLTGATPTGTYNHSYSFINNGIAVFNSQNNANFQNFVTDNTGIMIINVSVGLVFVSGTYDQLAGGTTILGTGAALQVNTLNLTSGLVLGNGTYTGSSFALGTGSAGSTVSPGAALNTAGNLTLAGNLNNIGGATFSFDLGGTGQGTTYDLLNLPNNVSFNNALLNVDLINGFTPQHSDIFTIIATAGNASGMFSNVSNGTITMSSGGSFNVTVNSNAVILSDFTAIPEPGTTALVAALTGLAALASRRLKADTQT